MSDPKPIRTIPAQILFQETRSSGAVTDEGDIVYQHTATLLPPRVFDTTRRYDWQRRFAIRSYQAGVQGLIAHVVTRVRPDGSEHARWWVQGGDNGGRRHFNTGAYDVKDAISEAQEHIIKWASRRFRVPADGSTPSAWDEVAR